MTTARLLMSVGAVAAAASLLGGCGEKPQALGAPKSDSAAYTGTVAKGFAAEGWKPGDKTSWEQQMRARTMNGQNEYVKTAR